MIDTNKIQVKAGKLDGQNILKAWENFNGDYFFALKAKGDDTYYSLVKSVRNKKTVASSGKLPQYAIDGDYYTAWSSEKSFD